MTDHKTTDEQMLEALFRQAREETADPSAALMARIMGDAEAELAAAAPAVQPVLASENLLRRLNRAVSEALGGWRGLAGLATAGVAGLAIGLGAPDAVSAFTGDFSALEGGVETELLSSDATLGVDGFLSSFDGLAVEG